ncbi:MAG: glycosyltransferase family A protein, partial [bacterium]
MTPPLVSVVLPTYNREALLRDSIASVVAQTHDHWELIIVDDGSTDGTRAFLETVADPRIHILLEEHTGNSAIARNVGIAKATGVYVAFQDDDDLWVPEKLAMQLGQLDAHPECGWSYTDAEFIDAAGQPNLLLRRPPWRTYDGWILEDLIAMRAAIPLPSVMVERRVLDIIGGFNESLPRNHDLELWMRVAEQSQVTALADRLTKVRHHPGNRFGLQLDEALRIDANLAGLQARTASPRIRRLCRERRTVMSAHFANRFRYADRYPEAWQVLRTSFPHSWWSVRWWMSVVKTWLRPMLPSGLLSRYQAWAV